MDKECLPTRDKNSTYHLVHLVREHSCFVSIFSWNLFPRRDSRRHAWRRAPTGSLRRYHRYAQHIDLTERTRRIALVPKNIVVWRTKCKANEWMNRMAMMMMMEGQHINPSSLETEPMRRLPTRRPLLPLSGRQGLVEALWEFFLFVVPVSNRLSHFIWSAWKNLSSQYTLISNFTSNVISWTFPVMSKDTNSPEYQELKTELRSLLISSQQGCTEQQIIKDYAAYNGAKPVPFRAMGYPSLIDLLRSMPDVARIDAKRVPPIIHGVANEETVHIKKMVMNQRSKRAPPKRNYAPYHTNGQATSYRPRLVSEFWRNVMSYFERKQCNVNWEGKVRWVCDIVL